MKLRYGDSFVECNIPSKNLLDILESKDSSAKPLDELLKRSFLNPVGKPRLIDLLRKNKPRDLIVIVSDITRSIANYSEILRFLVSEIVDAGVDEKNIEFVVASGIHKRHTPEEDRLIYGDLISAFRFSHHDCFNNLISIGKTSTGLEVLVNKRVRNADFIIATGKINFHYLAGFSGGRKSILPGISAYKTIRDNHCKLKYNGVSFGSTENNIIAQEMDEAARLFGCNYLLNMVETQRRETAQVFCGDTVFAFEQGVKFFKTTRVSKIFKRANCVIVSAGGHPKDRTFFLGHKAINSAAKAVKKGGAIILIAQCNKGFGNKKFMDYMLNNNTDELLNYPEQKIEVGGHRAFVTAQILHDYNIYILSDLESRILSKMNFIPIRNLDEGIKLIKKDYGEEFKAYILPEGEAVLPIMNGN